MKASEIAGRLKGILAEWKHGYLPQARSMISDLLRDVSEYSWEMRYRAEKARADALAKKVALKGPIDVFKCESEGCGAAFATEKSLGAHGTCHREQIDYKNGGKKPPRRPPPGYGKLKDPEAKGQRFHCPDKDCEYHFGSKTRLSRHVNKEHPLASMAKHVQKKIPDSSKFINKKTVKKVKKTRRIKNYAAKVAAGKVKVNPDLHCGGCGKGFDTPRGVRTHRARYCEGRKKKQ